MHTDGDGDTRPTAVLVFGFLAILGFLATALMGGISVSAVGEPDQPDPAIAAAISDELSSLDGVSSVEIKNSITCDGDCAETKHEYLATVELDPAATPEEISAIVETHDLVAPPKVGVAQAPITLRIGDDKSLRVAPVHYGFGVTQAEAFLVASTATAQIDVAYGPTDAGSSPILSIAGDVPGLVCEHTDHILRHVVPALSDAAVAGGISYSSVRFDCGAAHLEAGVAAGAKYQPHWSEVATTVDRLCVEQDCGTPKGVIRDLYVAFVDDVTTVTVEINPGKQLEGDDLDDVQSIVQSLSEGGAAAPQLDLRIY